MKNELIERIVSGMRVTGRLHLGHFHGVIKNWLELQNAYECFFFAADLHGLTTNYENPGNVKQQAFSMVADWLAAGVNPNQAKIFIQSWVPEHTELHLLLSMITPLSWLERVPTYKDQKEKLAEKDLDTYGFLGYPVLMSADILLYKAGLVPVGEDQIPHLELTREIARRFNHLYGQEKGFAEKALAALNKLGKKSAALYQDFRRRFQEQGDKEALTLAEALLNQQKNLTLADHERLRGYVFGTNKIILPEPAPLLTKVPKVSGLDGQKMSKSYENSIFLGESAAVIEEKIKTMPTDPARVRRNDPGNPDVCPVWSLHKIYSDKDTKAWVQEGCRSAGIGCLDCKGTLIKAIEKEQAPIRERAQEYQQNPQLISDILHDGADAAREIARDTLAEVKEVMGLEY
jgi:tryptophanyl-tRNA synthetase